MLVLLMRSLATARALSTRWWPVPRRQQRRPAPPRFRLSGTGDCWKLEVLIPPGACDSLG